jgi:hypothetical protein
MAVVYAWAFFVAGPGAHEWLNIEYMVPRRSFTVGFEGDQPWSRPVKES